MMGQAMRIVAAILVAAFAVVLGVAAGLAAARLTDSVAATIDAATIVLVAGGAFAGRLAAGRRHVAVVGGTAVVLPALIGLAVLPPLGDAQPSDPPPDGLQHVELPTGSELAYVRLPADGDARGTVVWIHGGPGTPDMEADVAFLAPLADDGFSIVVYDEIGAGRSARLTDPRAYTLERDVADLEALLDALDIARPILVGYSYGGTILAAYLAEHPTGAERAVFLAPGAIRPGREAAGMGIVDRLTDAQRREMYGLLLEPRAMWRWLLTQASPMAAHRFAGDAEMDTRFDRIYAESAPGLYCETPASAALPHRLGFYTNAMARDIPDLRRALRAATIPALVLKPECDYLPWSFATDLVDSLPNAQLVYVADAGHALHVEQPELALDTLRAFANGETLPIPPMTTLDPPPTWRGPVGEGE